MPLDRYMSKQPRTTTPRYSRSERRAEAEIDSFLKTAGASPALTVIQQLKTLAQ